MGKTAEELRHEIERSRSDLTTDLDAIGDRVSPHRIVERRTAAARTRLRTMKESVMGTAETMNDRALDLRDQAGGTAGGMATSAADAMHGAGEGVHHAAERVGAVPGMVRRETQGNPLAAGLVVFGLGLLAASVLPETRGERRMARKVQPQLEDAARSAAEAGRGMVDELRPTVEGAAEHLTDAAHDAADHLTGDTRDAARSVADTARHGAQEVADSTHR